MKSHLCFCCVCVLVLFGFVACVLWFGCICVLLVYVLCDFYCCSKHFQVLFFSFEFVLNLSSLCQVDCAPWHSLTIMQGLLTRLFKLSKVTPSLTLLILFKSTRFLHIRRPRWTFYCVKWVDACCSFGFQDWHLENGTCIPNGL